MTSLLANMNKGKIKMTKSPTSYANYFTQGKRAKLNFDISSYDLSWIDELNKENDIEEQYTKDFEDCDFPQYYEWSAEIKVAYNSAEKAAQNKLKEIALDCEHTFAFEDVTVYVNCKDGNSYFKTQHFNHGSLEIVALDEDSDFDSVETATYAFINDCEDWKSENLTAHERNNLLQKLESARDYQPSYNSDESECEHGDLGSVGYTHGELVTCPLCNELTEVW